MSSSQLTFIFSKGLNHLTDLDGYFWGLGQQQQQHQQQLQQQQQQHQQQQQQLLLLLQQQQPSCVMFI